MERENMLENMKRTGEGKKNDARLDKIKARKTTSRDACNKPKWKKNRSVKKKNKKQKKKKTERHTKKKKEN